MGKKQSTLEISRDSGDGNTNSGSSPESQSTNQHKYWFFTFNNYDPDQPEIISQKLRSFSKISKFIFQEEIGEQGTPHLQGHVELRIRARWTEFGLSKKIHWEPTRNFDAASKYCQKAETRNGKIYSLGFPRIKIIENLFPWQQEVFNISETEPDDRIINWIFSKDGCKGKTALTKYLAVKKHAICCSSGKSADINNFIFNSDLENTNIVIFDLARASGNVSYESLEKIKDGMIFNTKYETGCKLFNPPHIFVFANKAPIIENLSIDRWRIYEINASDSLVPIDAAQIRDCELSPEFNSDDHGEPAIASQFA